MESKRTLHSGNLVRGFYAGDRKLFILLRDGVRKIDGDLVRWDDMREALKNCMTLEGTIEIG